MVLIKQLLNKWNNENLYKENPIPNTSKINHSILFIFEVLSPI